MKYLKVTVPWEHGLHMRVASQIAVESKNLKSSIWLKVGNKAAEARSILSILLLCASIGTVLDVEISGDDEDRAAEVIQRVFNATSDWNES